MHGMRAVRLMNCSRCFARACQGRVCPKAHQVISALTADQLPAALRIPLPLPCWVKWSNPSLEWLAIPISCRGPPSIRGCRRWGMGRGKTSNTNKTSKTSKTSKTTKTNKTDKASKQALIPEVVSQANERTAHLSATAATITPTLHHQTAPPPRSAVLYVLHELSTFPPTTNCLQLLPSSSTTCRPNKSRLYLAAVSL